MRFFSSLSTIRITIYCVIAYIIKVVFIAIEVIISIYLLIVYMSIYKIRRRMEN